MVQSTSSTSSSKGNITMLATAFVGGPAIAATSASIGSASSPSLPPITAGEAFAAGDLLPSGSTAFGSLAMSIGYGGEGESLTYTSSATFAFTDPLTGDFKLTLVSPESSGSGFSDLTFDVRINSDDHSFEFTTLSDAETFFTDNLIDFKDIVGGVKNIVFTYGLTSKTPGDGFGFDLAIGEVSGAIPEPSTWSMALIGFGLLGLTICRNRVAGRTRSADGRALVLHRWNLAERQRRSFRFFFCPPDGFSPSFKPLPPLQADLPSRPSPQCPASRPATAAAVSALRRFRPPARGRTVASVVKKLKSSY
jgi:hypothetical protein